MEQDPRAWLAALRKSHEALVAQVKSLSPEQLRQQSFCTDWDVSQVVSHLGSGAEISLLGLESAVDERPGPGREDFVPIWDRWNAMGPEQRAVDMVVWDRRNVSVPEALDDHALASIHATFFGMELDAVTMLSLRLAEHTVHSWDVAVTFDPSAELLPEAVALVVDRLPWMASRVGKAGAVAAPRHIAVHTTSPERDLLLSIEDEVSLEKAGDQQAEPDGALTLPAAALVRLVYGRLGPQYTPAEVRAEGSADLDELRKVFPGV